MYYAIYDNTVGQGATLKKAYDDLKSIMGDLYVFDIIFVKGEEVAVEWSLTEIPKAS